MYRFIKCSTEPIRLSDVIRVLQNSKYRDSMFNIGGEYGIETEHGNYGVDVEDNKIIFYDVNSDMIEESYDSIEEMMHYLHI